jgi:Phage integrase family.
MHLVEKHARADSQKYIDNDDPEELEELIYNLSGDLENIAYDLKALRSNPNRNRKEGSSRNHSPRKSSDLSSAIPTISEAETNRLLDKHSIRYDANSPEYRRFQQLIARGMLESAGRRIKELGGYIHNYSPDELFKSITGDPSDHEKYSRAEIKPKHTMSALVESKLAERSHTSEDTKQFYRRVARVFEEYIGAQTDISTITREHFIEFKNLLIQSPKRRLKFKELTIRQVVKLPLEEREPLVTLETVRQYLGVLSMLWKHGVRLGWVTSNHADGVAPPVQMTEIKQGADPLTDEHLGAMFSAPLYTGCIDDERNYRKSGPNIVRRGRFWIPLISLFSGMRQNEICQLHVHDLRHEGSIYYLDLFDPNETENKSENKRFKNRTSLTRIVPVHPELERMGFIDFVFEQKKSGQTRLFPELPLVRGRYSPKFQKWFARFLESVCVKEGRHTCFHSLRGNFKDAAVRAGLSIEYYGRIGGWAEAKGASKDYGKLTPEDLHQALSKVSYPKLDLSHLYI